MHHVSLNIPHHRNSQSEAPHANCARHLLADSAAEVQQVVQLLASGLLYVDRPQQVVLEPTFGALEVHVQDGDTGSDQPGDLFPCIYLDISGAARWLGQAVHHRAGPADGGVGDWGRRKL